MILHLEVNEPLDFLCSLVLHLGHCLHQALFFFYTVLCTILDYTLASPFLITGVARDNDILGSTLLVRALKMIT